jgi:MoxR-like ATPase
VAVQRSASTAVRDVAVFGRLFESVVANVEVAIQGQAEAIRLALVCLLAEGHLLIEDVPGVGKTSLAKALAASFDLSSHRIQFTPDLLPSDVTGVIVYNRSNGKFDFRPGGIFANIVVGDEINRASPKTQSSMLEAMEEHQVTVDATTYRLPSPFMVIATQNPVDHQGTYPLPESQLDRFLMRIGMGYPERKSEIAMLDAHFASSALDHLGSVATEADVLAMIKLARQIHVAPVLRSYLVDLAHATRLHPSVALGVSPRATLALMRTARTYAASIGREYVVPDDVKVLAGPVLNHRLALAPEAAMAGTTAEQILTEVVAAVPVPTGRSAS